jgi:AAHS family 4-hydroxybenzoate transporter-like MFS transporter
MLSSKGALESSNIIDISQIIDIRKKIDGFVVNLLFWTFLIVLIDGFDFGAISYAAPVLIKQWHVDAKIFGGVFSAGLFGLLVGAVLFGYLGDRIGRKKAIILSMVEFAFFTLATMFCSSTSSLMWVRFIAGVGLGGANPLSIVLVNEYAPKHSLGKWVTIMFTGFSIGGALAGLLAAWLIPNYGWKSIFIIGGILPILAAIGVFFWLPESLRYLVVKNKDRDEVKKLILRLNPELQIDSNTVFTVEDRKPYQKFSPKLLFIGSLRFATPLIWLFYIASSLAVFFLKSWLPQLFVLSGLSLTQASLATSSYQFGSVLGGLVVGWLLDNVGIVWAAVYPVLGCFLVTLLGYKMSGTLLMITVFVTGLFVVGTQFIVTAITPMFYPTSYRSSAEGTANAIGKIGSIIGPGIGGVLIAAHLPLKELFYWTALPVAISAVIVFLLGLLHRRKIANVISESEKNVLQQDLII